MDVVAYTDPESFADAALPVFRRDPVRHTLALTVIRDLRGGRYPQREGRLLLGIVEDGAVIGAVFRTPPWPLGVSGLPARAVPLLAGYLADSGANLSGVSGPRGIADAFAQEWQQRTGQPATLHMAMRQYRLEMLRPPQRVAGRARTADAADAPLLADWWQAFAEEAGIGVGNSVDAESVRASMRTGTHYGVWADGDSDVAYAAASRPIDGMSRVGQVYTPPQHRRRGYGAAVTAAVSQWAADNGAADVVLFTDLANPVSNSIYQEIGYVPVTDAAEYRFAEA